jgi:V8-like Glu-specific endopeptidase
MLFKKEKGWAASWVVIPGYNDGDEPYGEYEAKTDGDGPSNAICAPGYTKDESSDDDIGYLIVSPRRNGQPNIGTSAGYLGFDAYDNETLTNMDVHICGYPFDKPADQPQKQGEFMYYEDGKIESVGKFSLNYALATASGMSGAPIIRAEAGRLDDLSTWHYWVVGVHTRHNSSVASGVRILKTDVKEFSKARADYP